MRRPRLRSLLVTSVLITSLLTPTVLAAQEDATPVAATDTPLILAAVTGWDAAADALLQDGSLPTLEAMVEQGSRGDLLSPGGTGPALTTLLTGAWPAEHGVVGDTFYRTGSPDFADVAAWTDPGIVQADTLPLAAERAGKLVAAVGWPGLDGDDAVLQGPVIGAPEAFSLPGVARTGATADEVATATASGVGLAALDFAPAAGWESLPESFSEPQAATFTVETTDEAVNPARTVNVLALDATDDGATNYDQLVVAAGKDDELSEPVAPGGWGTATVTLDGDLTGTTAGYTYKVVEFAPDLSQVSIYLTPVSRLHASWAGCKGEDACVAEGGFAESVSQRLGAAIVMDDAALRAGLIDQQTFAEQSAANLAQTQAAVSYLTGDLGIQPDLLLLGAAVSPFGSAGSAAATPVASGSAVAGNAGYAAVDALLSQAETALGGNPNLVLAALGSGVETSRVIDAGEVLAAAGLTEGAQPGNCLPAPVAAPEGTPDPEGLPVGPQLKACWDGQVAQIYINLDGREAAGSVAEDAASTLQDEIVAAFTAVQDPGVPGAGVVANVSRQGETRNVDGLDLLHPSRTGDVVVVLNAPYRFGSNANGEVVAEADLEAAAPVALNGTLFMAGPSLAAGVDVSAPATDLAQTSAMLLGVPGPYNASGNLLLNALKDGASLRDITILDISDFHGQLPPLSASADSMDAEGAVGSSYLVGGVAALDQWFDVYRAHARGPVLLVAAGDSVGATPPISTAFGDKPTIEIMDDMGFSADALGNHNFDVSSDYMFSELAPLADFPYLSVNLVPARDDATPLAGDPPYQPSVLFELDGAKIGLIGFSNPDIPNLTRPGALDPYRVIDPVQPITDEAARLREQGAVAVVAMGHMGALSGTLTEPTGPVVEVADAVEGVDVLIGDHTDVQVSAVRPNGVLLTENRSKGVMFTRVNLVVNVDTGELVYVTTDFHRPWVVGVTPDPRITARLEALQAELAPTLGRVIGSGAMAIPRSDSCGMETGRTCESLIGDVLTDAMRTSYNTDFALTNSGGIRAALTCPPEGGDFCPTDQGANQITQGQVLNVLPFGNVAVTLEITGAELKEMLETGVSHMPEASGAFPQVSGFCFTYDISREVGNRVTGAVRQATDGTCAGDAIDFSEDATYTLTTNDFTASGGDGYPNLFARASSRDVLANVLADAISETSALALPGEALNPRIQGRITCEGEGCPAPLP
ncbi:MAG: 5'-nucleotidase C-terminal domain-containing protein [Chloroflexota bacterium]|nr:5'-nucleotidase C-terminal domain-containing protein [Chloroflexota bacterium]